MEEVALKSTESQRPNLLTRGEVARMLRMSVSWLAQGNGPKVTRIGRKVFYLFEDCLEFVEQRRVGQGEQP